MSATDTYDHLAVAGSHVDVLKHVALRALIVAIQFEQKNTGNGIVVVDAFCGQGSYDLSDQVSEEYEKGIMRVDAKIESAPKPVQHCFQIVKGFDNFMQNYPGSPVIVDRLLGPNDDHRLVDLYVDSVEGLNRPDFQFVKGDSFHPDALPFLLPDDGKHPIILIDPSYVDPEDYHYAKELMTRILQANPAATVMLSFPLVQDSRYRFGYLKNLKDDMKKHVKVGYYSCTLTVDKDKVMGSGIFIANPPKDFDEVGCDEMTVNWLSATLLKNGRSDYTLDQWMKKLKTASN